MFETKAYKFKLKVRKFQLPTIYSFSAAEGETWLWVDSAHHHKKCHAVYVKPAKLKSDDANSLYDKAFENFASKWN